MSTIPTMGKYDVVVCGGGTAGIGAAVGAARRGTKTLLVEQTEVLGGLGAGGGVGNFCSGMGGLEGQGRVFHDVMEGLRNYGALGESCGWCERKGGQWQTECRLFDHQVLPFVLLEMAEAAGVECLFATTLCGVEMEGGRIARAILHNRSLLQSVEGAVFVDGTGDGLLARHAGAEVLPEDPNFEGVIQPSFMVFLRKVEEAKPQRLPGPRLYANDERPEYSIWGEPDGRVGLKMKLFDVQRFDTGTGPGYNEALLAMRRRVPEVVRDYQEHHDGSYVLDFVSPMLGLREGRRVAGDYVLTIDDVRAGQRFDDAVAYGTFTVDANRTREILPPYPIPYGSLLAKGVENCLVTGRCFSADRLALSSARVMPTGCFMGQAAGLAAARAAKEKRPLRAVPAEAIRTDLLEDATEADLLRERLGV